MNKSYPLVSVVVPAFNRAHCILATVESALLQDYPNLEIIIVDDASRDNITEIVEKICDSRVLYYRHEKNQGGAAARNTGIAHASGEYIAFLDSDDLWDTDKITKQMNLLCRLGANFGACYCWFKVITTEGKEIGRNTGLVTGNALEHLLQENVIGTFSVLLAKTSVLKAAGGMDVDMKSCQDWDLYIRLAQVTQFCCVEEVLVSYLTNSVDTARISSNPKSLIAGHARMLRKWGDLVDRLPKQEKQKTYLKFQEVYCLSGYITGVIYTAFKSGFPYSIPQPISQVRRIVRACYRKITKTYGY